MKATKRSDKRVFELHRLAIVKVGTLVRNLSGLTEGVSVYAKHKLNLTFILEVVLKQLLISEHLLQYYNSNQSIAKESSSSPIPMNDCR